MSKMCSQVFVFFTTLSLISGFALGGISFLYPTNSPDSTMGQPSTVLPDCNSIVSELNPCVGYVLKSETNPSDACCAGVKSLRQYNSNKAARQAICRCLQSVAHMFGEIDYSLLGGLPKMCRASVKLPADISPSFDCSKA